MCRVGDPYVHDPWHPAAWDGWSGSPSAFHAGWAVGRWDDVQVTTSLSNSAPANVVSNLLIHVVSRADRLRFPVELSVGREIVTIPIDGQLQRFTAYVSPRAVPEPWQPSMAARSSLSVPRDDCRPLRSPRLPTGRSANPLKSTTYRTPWGADGNGLWCSPRLSAPTFEARAPGET